jgi:hypothetical protein
VALARRRFSPAARRREALFLPIQAGASFDRKEEEHSSVKMEILYTSCAGLDVQKKTVKVCLLR